MDPSKVSAVSSRRVPDSKELQHFLGFANFYRRSYQDLKGRFTSAPILQVPDPAGQLVVEVDASDVGVGAMP